MKKCEIELLIAPGGCSKCDLAKEKIEKLIKKYKGKIKFKETDITKDSTKLVKFGIMSTPALIINGKLEFEGVPNEKKLQEKIEACLA